MKKAIMQDGDIHKEKEDMIFNPYNKNNREISQSDINNILKNYGVPDTVHNLNLYKRAFIHKSYCKRPHLENVANEIIIAKHNIDNEPNTPTKYGVRGIPTMLLFKGGELKATKVGATTKSNIVSWIKENI